MINPIILHPDSTVFVYSIQIEALPRDIEEVFREIQEHPLVRDVVLAAAGPKV
ncbi:MAG: hypothetical protein ACJ8R9_10840 [Steroidobacteraceae bacterium]